MTKTIIFDSDYGKIYMEASDDVVDALPRSSGPTAPLSGGEEDEPIRVPKKFGDAISSLRAYAWTIQDVVHGMKPVPNEVSIQVGLKLDASLNFKVVKIGAGTDMTVNIKWDPSQNVS